MGVGLIHSGRRYEHSRIPRTLDGIREYYKERGYSEDPLETSEEGQVASFAKPIPGETGESRHHVRIIEKSSRYKIDAHVDKHDPLQNPIGHITSDVLGSPKHTVSYVEKAD